MMSIFRRFLGQICHRASTAVKTTWALGRSALVAERFQIRQSWVGEIGFEGRDPCIFSSFDHDSIISDYVFHYLEQLRALNFAIVFVCTSKRIRPQDLDRLTRVCSWVVLRRNVGLDIGSWKVGIGFVPDAFDQDRLLIANDSVYGPLFDLNEALRMAEEGEWDVWGISDSWEHHYHVQSYFIMLEKHFLQSNVCRRFFKRIRFLPEKTLIIRWYEVGLSRTALRAGFRVGAVCSYLNLKPGFFDRMVSSLEEDATEKREKNTLPSYRIEERQMANTLAAFLARGTPLNQTHFFWRALLENARCPFLKVELLRDNPGGLADLRYWPEMVAQYSDYPAQMIVEHLKRVIRNRAP